MPVVHVRKRLQHYVTSLIDAILSVMSGFIIEQRTIDFNPLFSSLKMTKSFIFRIIYNTKFSEIRHLIRKCHRVLFIEGGR